MAKAKKLPSGSWRCQVYSHTEQDGKRVYKSFTCDDPTPKGKRRCEQMAAEWALEKESYRSSYSMTLSAAIEAYIEARKNVLSPRTPSDYRSLARNHLNDLKDLPIDRITNEQIQAQINKEARSVSPKTVRNINALLTGVLGAYRPDFRVKIDLPKKVRPNLYTPNDEDVARLIEVSKGTSLELAILLAAFGTMRRGEICALDASDLSGNVVHVSKSMVYVAGEWQLKAPKSYAGDRYVELPDFIAKMFPVSGKVVNICNPNQLTKSFIQLVRRSGVPHFRFHDLRHYSASIQHALGIPDSYIMQSGGWSSDSVLKSVYRHALSDQTKQMSSAKNSYFSNLYNTKCNTRSEKVL